MPHARKDTRRGALLVWVRCCVVDSLKTHQVARCTLVGRTLQVLLEARHRKCPEGPSERGQVGRGLREGRVTQGGHFCDTKSKCSRADRSFYT